MLDRIRKQWRETGGPNPARWIVLPAALSLTDLGATLVGQCPAYWRGDYSQVIEANPLGWLLLRIYPWAFLGAGLVWAVCFSAFILRAPRRWALSASMALIAGHTIGTCSWLPRLVSQGELAAVAFFLGAAVLAWPTWRAWRKEHFSHRPAIASPPEREMLVRAGEGS